MKKQKYSSETARKVAEFVELVQRAKIWRTRWFVIWFHWKGIE